MSKKQQVSEKLGADIVESRTSLYNPLLQKPIALHPVGPGSYPAGYGGYSYIGPPPDFGGTYGKYEDTAGREQVGIKSSKMFSIHDGSPTQLKADLSPEEREALLAQMDSALEEHKCEHCRSVLAISVASKLDKVWCPHCGSEMNDKAAEKVKQCVSKLGEQNMTTVEAKAQKAKADLAKEAMKAKAPMEHNKDVKPEAAEMKEHEEAQKKADKIEPMKELAKDPVKASIEKSQILAKKREQMRAAVKAYRERKAKTTAETAPMATPAVEVAPAAAPVADVAAAPMAPTTEVVKPGFSSETLASLRRELRVMAATNPGKFAEVRKNPKISAICADVEKKLLPKAKRLQIRAELAVLAAEDAKAAEELEKQLDFIAPEILVEDQAKAEQSESPQEEKAEHEMQAEAGKEEVVPIAEAAKEEPKAEEKKEEQAEQAEAMKTEFLASLDGLKCEKIEMSLYGENTANPFWNVTVDAEPVGRIYLADQQVEDPQAIKAAFCNESYADNFGQAAGQVGLKQLLTITKAHLFAHRMDKTEVAARAKEQALVEVKAEMEEKMQTLRSDFLKAASLAMVASDKNIYQDEAGHALKGNLFNALVQAGLNTDGAVWAVEEGFRASDEYFNFIMAKAQEIMDMPKEARESLEKTIMNSGRLALASQEPQEESLAQRLVKSSVNVIAMGEMVSGEDREGIRNQLGLNPYRR